MPRKFSYAHCLDQYLYSDTALRINPKASMGRRKKTQDTNMYFIYFVSTTILATLSVKSLPGTITSCNSFRTAGVCRPSDYREAGTV